MTNTVSDIRVIINDPKRRGFGKGGGGGGVIIVPLCVAGKLKYVI